MAGQRISFFLAFGQPERSTRVGELWLTSRRAIKANTCTFREEVLSESAVGVRLRLVGTVDCEGLLSIGGMDWQ